LEDDTYTHTQRKRDDSLLSLLSFERGGRKHIPYAASFAK
jgi:hypothetical protein